jgi:hypothetical protein
LLATTVFGAAGFLRSPGLLSLRGSDLSAGDVAILRRQVIRSKEGAELLVEIPFGRTGMGFPFPQADFGFPLCKGGFRFLLCVAGFGFPF